jgi:hypothetical protein
VDQSWRDWCTQIFSCSIMDKKKNSAPPDSGDCACSIEGRRPEVRDRRRVHGGPPGRCPIDRLGRTCRGKEKTLNRPSSRRGMLNKNRRPSCRRLRELGSSAKALLVSQRLTGPRRMEKPVLTSTMGTVPVSECPPPPWPSRWSPTAGATPSRAGSPWRCRR